MLCTLTGMGAQVGFMMYIITLAILIGLLNSYFRYYNFINAYFMLAVGGFFNGYVTSRMMVYFGSHEWKFSASASAFVLPWGIILILILVDIIEYFEKAN